MKINQNNQVIQEGFLGYTLKTQIYLIMPNF